MPNPPKPPDPATVARGKATCPLRRLRETLADQERAAAEGWSHGAIERAGDS